MRKQFQRKSVLEVLTFMKFRKLRVDGEEPSSKKEVLKFVTFLKLLVGVLRG
jgi:hypothetical protein